MKDPRGKIEQMVADARAADRPRFTEDERILLANAAAESELEGDYIGHVPGNSTSVALWGDWLRNTHFGAPPRSRGGAAGIPTPRSPGAPVDTGALDDGGFDGVGEFMAAVADYTRGRGLDPRLEDRQAHAAIATGSDSAGGFAVPTQFVARAFAEDSAATDTILLANCDRVVMTSDEMTAPTFVDTTHATSPYGISWGSVAEATQWDAADSPTLRSVKLKAAKHGALFHVANEWLADTHPAMRQRLDTIWSSSLRWYVEGRLWNGSGAGEPLGALNAPATLEISKEAAQAAATIVTENLLKMWARLRPGAHGRALWAANQTTFAQLASLTLDVGTAGSTVGLLRMSDGATGTPASTVMGRPLHFSEHLPALGSSGDIVVLDPLAYLIGDRQAVTIEASPHHRFDYDQTSFRCKVRFDGQPEASSTFTPAHGDTCGWAVKLEART